MLAAVEPLRLYEGEPGHPTAAQRAAVTRAERRACELLPDLSELPLWDWRRAPSARANAVTRFYPGWTVVFISDSLSPTQTYSTSLHELRHVADRELIVGDRLSKEEAELRAENFSGFAQGGHTDMSFSFDCCRYVDALVAQGLSRTAAWQKVNSMHPSQIPARTPAGVATRNGHGRGRPDAGPLLLGPRCQVQRLDGSTCGGLLSPSFPGATKSQTCNRCGRSQYAG